MKELYYSKNPFDGNWCTDDITELDLEKGDTYFVGERQDIEPADLVPEWLASEVIERMEELLYDEVGEVAEGRLHICSGAEEGLLSLIREWANNNVTLSCYKINSIKEEVYTQNNHPTSV